MIEVRGATALAENRRIGPGAAGAPNADERPARPNTGGLTLLNRAEAALASSEAQLQHLLDQASDLILSLDPAGRIISANCAWCAALGYSAAEIAGLSLFAIIAPEDRARCRDLVRHSVAGAAGGPVETTFLTRDGWPIAVAGDLRCRGEAGRPRLLRGIFRDVTAQRVRERQHAHAALHDPLTDLPNHAALDDWLRQALARAEARDERVALLLLDLDGFGRLNARLGPALGDCLLVKIADRLRRAASHGDAVARLAGDRFAVALAPGTTPAAAGRFAERLLATATAPVMLDGAPTRISAGIGVALSAPRADAAALLAAATGALELAKGLGQGRCAFAFAGED